MLHPALETTGNVDNKPGRVIPLIRPTSKSPAVKRAPVLPQENSASASLALTALAATTKDESFLRRIARTGSSFISITSVVLTIVIRVGSVIYCSIAVLSPYKNKF